MKQHSDDVRVFSALPTRHYQLADPRRPCRRAATALMALACIATLVRLSVQDRTLLTALLYYATPLPVLIVVWLVAALLAVKAARTRAGLLSGVCALATAVWCHVGQHYPRVPTHGGEPSLPPVASTLTSNAASIVTIRVLFWNMHGGARGLRACADLVERYDADVAGLVEARDRNEWVDNWWQATLPQYRVIYGSGRLALLVRTQPHTDPLGHARVSRARQVEFGELGGSGRYLSAVVDAGGAPHRIVVADVLHSLATSRKPALEALGALCRRFENERLIICGDMNTPADSVHFESLRKTCTNAFEAAGGGWPFTWPAPVPVLSLDQIWFRGGITARRCEIGWTLASDHQPIYAEFRAFEPAAGETGVSDADQLRR